MLALVVVLHFLHWQSSAPFWQSFYHTSLHSILSRTYRILSSAFCLCIARIFSSHLLSHRFPSHITVLLHLAVATAILPAVICLSFDRSDCDQTYLLYIQLHQSTRLWTFCPDFVQARWWSQYNKSRQCGSYTSSFEGRGSCISSTQNQL
jgi:hypothetical protein